MTDYAKGEFEVTINPISDFRQLDNLGLLTIQKVFHGDLEATSTGNMLSLKTEVNAGGYVALEKVEGVLQEKKEVLLYNTAAK